MYRRIIPVSKVSAADTPIFRESCLFVFLRIAMPDNRGSTVYGIAHFMASFEGYSMQSVPNKNLMTDIIIEVTVLQRAGLVRVYIIVRHCFGGRCLWDLEAQRH